VLLLNWALNAYLRGGKPQVDAAAYKPRPFAQGPAGSAGAGRAIPCRSPSDHAEVEGDKVYTVRSQFVSTDRRGEQHKRPWIVTIEYKGSPPRYEQLEAPFV
jgi:hypothetical protein